MPDYDKCRRLRNAYLASEQACNTRQDAQTFRYFLRDKAAFFRAALDYFQPEEEVKVVAEVDQGGAK